MPTGCLLHWCLIPPAYLCATSLARPVLPPPPDFHPNHFEFPRCQCHPPNTQSAPPIFVGGREEAQTRLQMRLSPSPPLPLSQVLCAGGKMQQGMSGWVIRGGEKRGGDLNHNQMGPVGAWESRVQRKKKGGLRGGRRKKVKGRKTKVFLHHPLQNLFLYLLYK